MKTVSFTYPLPADEDVLTRAKELGYKERIMDESQLVDGKIPMEHATDADGALLYERESFGFNEETLEPEYGDFVLDENGEKKPIMRQKDIMIDNPEAAHVFVAEKARQEVAKFLVGSVERQTLTAAKQEAAQLVKAAEAEVEAVKAQVLESIAVEITE